MFLLVATSLFVACDNGETIRIPDVTITMEVGVETFDATVLSDASYNFGYQNDNLIYEYRKDETYGNWWGFALSNNFDKEDATAANQYSVYNDGAASGKNFLIYYYDTYNVENNAPCDILCGSDKDYDFISVKLCISTFTYHSIVTGSNAYARPFAEGDYLKVSFIALDDAGAECDSVDFYLADYRDGKSYVADDWITVDLSSLQDNPRGLRVRMETTDVGEWGPNTPLYVCLDDFVYLVTSVKQ